MSPDNEERPENEDASLEEAAEADDTLSPGSEPGGPEYSEEETEGRAG
ncbi:MAG: hypothetical protein M3377_05720 [Actinomycetota bacterium]|nr:hypothetical protein [Actinomycetota bacterium]